MIGTVDSSFDPVAYLEQAIGRQLDAEDVRRRRWQHKLSLLSTAGLRPGVDSYLSEARWLGLSTAIVTSDTETWVTDHLTRLQVTHTWDCVVCANGDAARAKPAPDLYLAALRRLGLAASEAIAFEDSPNGIRAAKAAGLVCVATPNPVTAQLDLTGADLVVESLAGLPLHSLLDRLAKPAAW